MSLFELIGKYSFEKIGKYLDINDICSLIKSIPFSINYITKLDLTKIDDNKKQLIFDNLYKFVNLEKLKLENYKGNSIDFSKK
jgi:hypothetical protein